MPERFPRISNAIDIRIALMAMLACTACDEGLPYQNYPPCISNLVSGAGDLMSNHDHCGACFHACGRDNVCEARQVRRESELGALARACAPARG